MIDSWRKREAERRRFAAGNRILNRWVIERDSSVELACKIGWSDERAAIECDSVSVGKPFPECDREVPLPPS
jgi:hypothetical protein